MMTKAIYNKELKKYVQGIEKERNFAENVRSMFKNPLSKFVIFSLILIIMQVIATATADLDKPLIQTAFMSAIGTTLIYSIIAIGFCLLLGYSGLASLGTAGFIGIGAYICYFFMQEWGLPYIVVFIATLLVSIVLGIAVGFISLRIEGIYLAIITLGLSEILRNAFQVIKSVITIKLSNIKLFGVKTSKDVIFFLIVFTLFILMWIVSNLINSPTGRAMLAMKNSTSAAQAFGISLMKYRLLAFVISTIYAAIAGILYMLYIRSISTSMSTIFMLSTSLNILGAVIIGGYKSIWGAIGGTFLIYGIDKMFLQDIKFFNQNPTFIMILSGVLIILVVMFYPGGLAELFMKLKLKLWQKKLARRTKKYGN